MNHHLHDVQTIQGNKPLSIPRRFWAWLTGKNFNKPPIQYFVPDQVLLQVSHPNSLIKEDLAKTIGDFLTGQGVKIGSYSKGPDANRIETHGPAAHSANGTSWKEQLRPPDPESITTISLNDDKGQMFSIVPVYLKDAHPHDESHKTLIEVLISAYQDYKNNNNSPIRISADITLKSVSLNWIMSAAYHGCATGGPGGWPIQAQEPEGDDWKFYKAQDQNGFASNELLSTGDGTEVHVAILDTAPTEHALETAYTEWRWGHPLIASLLKKKNAPLHLYPAINPDPYMTATLSLLGHRYWMRDHGLFVAGIIHAIASKATLHLYEVLNPYGAASIENVARALVKVMDNKEIKRPLIINCSFMFGVPVEGVLDQDFPRELRDQQDFIKHLIQTPRDLFEWVTQQEHVYVIAAAGNDGVHNNNSAPSRPSTRYPAAFKGVWGVAAAPKKASLQNGRYRAATYSNKADDQVPPEGYVTLGGEPGVGNGVLGVYIGDFPTAKARGCLPTLLRSFTLGVPPLGKLPKNYDTLAPEDIEYKRNTTGWAWWAGTSFATPIITGKLAAEFSAGSSDVERALVDANRLLPIAPGAAAGIADLRTPEGEKVILVTQKAEES